MQMKIKNKVVNLKECKTIFSQLRGLMFRFKLKEDGLLFVFNKEKKVFLHMFFVFFPIDVVCLDENKKIVEIIENVKPFDPLIICPKCKYVVELKRGLLDK